MILTDIIYFKEKVQVVEGINMMGKSLLISQKKKKWWSSDWHTEQWLSECLPNEHMNWLTFMHDIYLGYLPFLERHWHSQSKLGDPLVSIAFHHTPVLNLSSRLLRLIPLLLLYLLGARSRGSRLLAHLLISLLHC